MLKRILSVTLLATCVNGLADDGDAIATTVATLLPGQTILAINDSPLPGVRAVTVGVNVFYVSADGKFLLGGPLLSAAGQNLTEPRVAAARTKLLDAHGDTPLYRYPAEPARHTVTVVTDIDCPYCRRLHNDLPAYREAGIDVSYVMLPRAGKNSDSYRKTVSAACADDPETAITAAMNGKPIPTATCEHPIDEHMALARRLGVTSTPTIVLQDGRIVLGHKSATALLSQIDR